MSQRKQIQLEPSALEKDSIKCRENIEVLTGQIKTLEKDIDDKKVLIKYYKDRIWNNMRKQDENESYYGG